MKKRPRIREHLTYANVMVTVLTFIVLGGGAYAAAELGKHSVGTKQLKRNSVTAAKIRRNAVTAAKIKQGAVTGAKVKDASLEGADLRDGSVTGADVNAASMPFPRITHRARGSSTFALTNQFRAYPLDNPNYTQAANEDDGYAGAVDLTFQSTCLPPRYAIAYVLIDSSDPTKPRSQDIGASGFFNDETSNTVQGRMQIGTAGTDPGRFEAGVAQNHVLTLAIAANCNGGGSGATATFGGVDVLGVTP
jgi:hypothetical protein